MDNATIASITGVIAPWKKRLNKITRTTCNTYAKKLKKKQWYNNRPWAQKRTFWKGHFSGFCKFLSDEVETIFWEREAKRSKLFKSRFDYRKLLKKWYWSYLELKNECSDRLKRTFFSFLQIFEWRRWNRFLGKRDNSAKNFSIKSTLLRAI